MFTYMTSDILKVFKDNYCQDGYSPLNVMFTCTEKIGAMGTLQGKDLKQRQETCDIFDFLEIQASYLL